MRQLKAIEFCAGAGGQALGLEQAGFDHGLLVDNDKDCCATLRENRLTWRVEAADMSTYQLEDMGPVDLFAAGLPCPPFSVAGKQLGAKDERNLFPAALRLIKQAHPKFVLIENVRGFLAASFASYREELRAAFEDMGYQIDWRLLDARNFGVSQSRTRVAIVAARREYFAAFKFPQADEQPLPVGELLIDLMSQNGWRGAEEWKAQAQGIAPTIVGGSKKHGGPDLGPTRARAAWEKLGVNGKSVAEQAPEPDHVGMPRLTPRMVARVQGFPDDWRFTGRKTSAYRQIGNAFPPPVAKALGISIRDSVLAVENGILPAVAAE